MLSQISKAKQNFYNSMDNHQIKGLGTSWFSMVVVLESSDNTYLKYPVKGVIRFCEQGTDLSIISAVFHSLKEDGSLGAPVEVKNPTFRADKGGNIDLPNVPKISNLPDKISRHIHTEAKNRKDDAGYGGEFGDRGAGHLEDCLAHWHDGIQYAITGETKIYAEVVQQIARNEDPEYAEYLRLQEKFGKA